MSGQDQEPGTYWEGFTEGVKYTHEITADGMRYMEQLNQSLPPLPTPTVRRAGFWLVATDVTGLFAGAFGITAGSFEHGPRLVLFAFGWVFGLWTGHRAWWWRHPS